MNETTLHQARAAKAKVLAAFRHNRSVVGVITTRTWRLPPPPGASSTHSLGRIENPAQLSPGSSSTVTA